MKYCRGKKVTHTLQQSSNKSLSVWNQYEIPTHCFVFWYIGYNIGNMLSVHLWYNDILITPLVCLNSSQGSIHRAAQLVHIWPIVVTKVMILKHWLWNITGYVSWGWNTLHVKDLYCRFRKSRSSRLNFSSLCIAPKRSIINQSINFLVLLEYTFCQIVQSLGKGR